MASLSPPSLYVTCAPRLGGKQTVFCLCRSTGALPTRSPRGSYHEPTIRELMRDEMIATRRAAPQRRSDPEICEAGRRGWADQTQQRPPANSCSQPVPSPQRAK